jgi:signal-transduction protein with cAMP-binding, CBS, and nucleotidyltransferase domain
MKIYKKVFKTIFSQKKLFITSDSTKDELSLYLTTNIEASKVVNLDGSFFFTTPKETLKIASEKMVKEKIGSLLVLNDKRECIGIITERDFLKVISSNLTDGRVEDIMTKGEQLKYVSPKDNINTVMHLMTDHQIRHVPVFENGKPKGKEKNKNRNDIN